MSEASWADVGEYDDYRLDDPFRKPACEIKYVERWCSCSGTPELKTIVAPASFWVFYTPPWCTCHI